MQKNMKAVILAGGSGTRLWPISRKDKPKQFQTITSKRTMFQETYTRLLKEFDCADIYISTNRDYVDEVIAEIPEIPHKNIIAEPVSRNTAPGIALVSAIVAAHHGDDTIIAVFPADHMIQNDDVLMHAVGAAGAFISSHVDHIVTLGLVPTYPEIGYGYIKKGAIIEGENIFAVERFVEKPDSETAQKYVTQGDYYWNAGMFIFGAGAMLAKYEKYIPDTHRRMMTIADALDREDYDAVLAMEYAQAENISVDYAILENDNDIVVIPVEGLGWSDVGSWSALKDALIGEGKEHLVRGEHVDFESENLVVYGSKKPIITIGTKDLVIVDTDDAILVCARDKSQLVSGVVKSLADSKHKELI